ncbi:MAG: EAL domain-containing protein [Pseudomonadota bacterium]
MRAPSVRTYTLMLLGFGAFILATLGWHMLDRLHAIEQAQRQEGVEAARLEFKRAVENTLAQVAGLAEQIAGWDEVRQQLASPSYYTYWRDNRATAQGLWPTYVRGVELYDTQGALLSSFHAKLPGQLPDGLDALLVVAEDGGLCMLRFAAVVEPGDALQPVLGYIGLRVDLLGAMRNLHRFAYLDPDSLELSPHPQGMYTLDKAPGMIDYSPRQAGWVSTLPSLMRQTLLQFMLAFFLLVALHYLLVTRLFTRPLRRLRDELARLRAGEAVVGSSSEALPVQELSEVRDALRDYRQSLERAHDELDRTNAKLWTEAHVDALTGVYNRRAFDEDWARLLQADEDTPLALLLLDCDFFKSINDSYGHEIGDRVLQEIARLVCAELRREDRLYRLGGDEFLAILWGAQEKQALQVAERCRVAVMTHPVERLGIHERLRVSIGVVASEHPRDELHDLLRRVDMAMYHAKRGVGEHKVVLFKQELDASLGEWSNHLVHAVLEAVDSGHGIAMHYQPVVETATGQAAYYEALLRIRDERGIISPAETLPVAARRGLETRLDLAVLRSVLADLEAGDIPRGTGVAINLDGESIGDPEVAAVVEAFSPYVKDYKVVLEITETTLISRFELINQVLEHYRAMGLRVALDDFGSGYSSLRYLARMPVDIVKLDRSLVEAYSQDKALRSMVVHVVEMLRDSGFDIVAEGIETEAQRQAFGRLGVGYLQGWAFGRPERPAQAVQRPHVAVSSFEIE